MNYLKLFEDGTSEAVDVKPSWGMYEKEHALDNREVYIDGNWYSTTGGELVTNGTFDTDISGWDTTIGEGTIVSDSSTLLFTQINSTYQAISQNVPTIIGKEYILKYNDSYISGQGYILKLGSASNYYVSSTVVSGEKKFSFIAESTSTLIDFRRYDSNGVFRLDNISVYKTEPTIDTLQLPHTYLSNKGKLAGIEVASGTPVDIHYDELAPTLVEDTIKTSNLVVGDRVIFEDRPVFTGYAGGTNITSAGVIFDWAVELDTHNAYNNGIWTCPKAGWYKFNPRVRNAHTNTTSAIVNSEMYINGVLEVRFYSDGTSYQKFIAVEPTIMKYLEVGATMYIESMTASSTHYISFINGKVLTNIVITYEGA